MTIWIIIIAVVLIGMGIPIAFSFGLAAMAAMIIIGNTNLLVLAPIQIFGGLSSFLLIAVPLFILAGVLMANTRFADDIFRFTEALVGWSTGGLGHVNVVASLIFGGMSGSATADAGGLGRLFISMMTRYGYPLGYAAALTGTSAIVAVLVPPSIMAVLYGAVANQSIARTLLAGLLPGLMIGLLLMFYNYFTSRRYKWGEVRRFSAWEVATSFKKAFFPLLTPVILLGGIVSGYFTPTEAAGVTVFYVLLIDRLLYRELGLRVLRDVMLQTARLSGSALLILATASLVTFILTIEGVPGTLAALASNVESREFFLLGLLIILCVAGMFLDPVSALIVLVPLLLPSALLFGIDPIHFGVIVITALGLGLITPPVGPVLFVTSAVSGVPVERLSREMVPLYAVVFVGLLLITFVPSISLWLPDALLSR